MSYENSLTSSVNDYISCVLTFKLAKARHSKELVLAAKSAREYLNDPQTLLTPDFILRRHIQARHPDLLPQGKQIPDLINGCNVPWDMEVTDHIATLLYQAYRKELSLKKKNWQEYLTGKNIQKRENLMQVAFALRMDVDTTMDLMLATDAEPYNVRNPLDFICMFCQQEPGRYTWTEAMQMLADFRKAASGSAEAPSAPTPGMSEELKNGLEDIFESYLGQTRSKEALLSYMTANVSEFSEDSVSATRMAGLLELAKALKILYPIRWVSYNEHKDGKIQNYAVEIPDNEADGYPSLNDLVWAIFQQNSWKEILWGPKKDEDKQLFMLWNTFEERIMAIERLRSGGKNARKPERRDVLLLIYFFITGYRYLKSACDADPEKRQEVYIKTEKDVVRKFLPSPAERMEQLQDLCGMDTGFEFCFRYVLRRLEEAYRNPEDAVQRYRKLIRVMDMFLVELGYRELYLPAKVDRVMILALLSGEPEEMLPILLSRLQLEDLEEGA